MSCRIGNVTFGPVIVANIHQALMCKDLWKNKRLVKEMYGIVVQTVYF